MFEHSLSMSEFLNSIQFSFGSLLHLALVLNQLVVPNCAQFALLPLPGFPFSHAHRIAGTPLKRQ